MYKVSSEDLTEIKLNESDTVTSVLQNVAVILSTIQGGVPLGREIGLVGRFLDMPVDRAKVVMMAEVQEALITFEPRATLQDVTFAEDTNIPGRVIPTVHVEVENG